MKMNHLCRRLIAVLALGSICFFSASRGLADDWPQWRGPNRNGISAEKISWPSSGPKQLWKAAVGEGYSSVSISHGRAYTMGNVNNQDTVWCLDAKTGAVVWKYSCPCPTIKQFPGPRATPTVDGNLVYAVSRTGDLLALDAMKGTVVWSTNYVKNFGAREPRWAFACSPLVDGKLLLVNAGGTGASVVAFDKTTGGVAWKSGTDAAGYASPVTFTLGMQRGVAMFSASGLYGYNLADGRELWNAKWATQSGINVSDPMVLGDKVLITSGYGFGCSLLKITNTSAEQVYTNKNLSCHTGSLVLIGGFLYGYTGQVNAPALICMDPNTGEAKWTNPKAGGSLIAAGNNLIIQSVTGKLIMAEAAPGGYKELGTAPALTGACWTAPSLANGCVYCRNTAGDVVCIDLSGTGIVQAQTLKPLNTPSALNTLKPLSVPTTPNTLNAPAATQNAGAGKTTPEIEKSMLMPDGPEKIKALVSAAQEWAKKEPLAALSWALQLPPALAGKISTAVALVNPPVVADWYIQQNDKGKLPLHGLMISWAMADPTAAETWCMKAPKSVRSLAFFSVADGLVRKDRTSGPAWVEKLKGEPAEDRLAAIQGVALLWGRGDVVATAAWIKQLKPDEMKFAASVACGFAYTAQLKTQGVTRDDAVKAWLKQFPFSDQEKEALLKGPAPSSDVTKMK